MQGTATAAAHAFLGIPLEFADLASVRFAHSPVRELVASLHVIGDARRHYMYRTWLSEVSTRLGGLRLGRLTALATIGRGAVSFITPDPTTTWGSIADELDAVASTPSALVRAELEVKHRGRQIPGALRTLYEDPSAHLPALVADMAKYWHQAIEPVWPRLRALCMADVSYRAEQFAGGGVARVLSVLHPQTAFIDGKLLISQVSQRGFSRLDGRSLVLIPCAFSWPDLTAHVPTMSASANGSYGQPQPSLTYPPRGVAGAWEARAARPAPLDALVGRTRSALLALLGLPASTTQLAEQLNLSAAAVSQHLQILKDSGLASAHRHGKVVLYQRTTAATVLLSATRAG